MGKAKKTGRELNPHADDVNSMYKSKLFGIILIVLGVFGVLVVIHRLAAYVYEYDPDYSPVDYGRFYIMYFFTIQSNLLVCFYMFMMAAGIFGNKRAQKIAFNPTFGAMVTTYIIVTGVVYSGGIPLGFSTPFQWDTALHRMLSFIQIYHHMIIPAFMLVIWFFPANNRKIPYKKMWITGIYPLVYSLFSIARGAWSDPTFYPYPFYRPDFFWEIFFGDKPLNLAEAYLLMLPILIAGIMLFVGLAMLLALARNKMVCKRQ